MMLSEKKFFMLLKLKYYVKEYQNFKHAFCEWMKDFWFLLYNFFDNVCFSFKYFLLSKKAC